MRLIAASLSVLLCASGGSASAQTLERGEALWRECRVCHQVAAPDGTLIARGGRAAPNLFAIVGRPAGTDTSFRRYSDAMKAAAQDGLEWTEANLLEYVQDPAGFLERVTGQTVIDSKMRVSVPLDARDLIAYLEAMAP